MSGRADHLRERLERAQIAVYFIAIGVGVVSALAIPGTTRLEPAINPALAVMLFATFLQLPLAEVGRALSRGRFLAALLAGNFVVVPLLVAAIAIFLPADPLVKLGVLMVLLTPCIDYVVTFAHLGRADARPLLAATPILLIAQMLLLPLYLGIFLGADAARLIQAGPFVHAFVWLIAIPLALAGVVQYVGGRGGSPARLTAWLGVLPVPATAGVLLIVVAAVVPQLGLAGRAVFGVLPHYVVFAALAPVAGWWTARLLRLDVQAGRAVAFSLGTRNSLVVLPLALAVPNAVPILPAVIVTQTLVELLSELVYVRLIPALADRRPAGFEGEPR